MDYSSSTNSSTNKISANKIREEDEAYFKLCQIINYAIQSKDTGVLDSQLSFWLLEYDVDSFVCPSYKAKVKALLSEISQIRAYIETLMVKQPAFDLSRAYDKLCVVVRDNKDITELKSKINGWKSKYPPDKFSDYFKSKIKRITSDSHLKRVAFDQEKAYNELQEILRFSEDLYIEELSPKIEEWKKNYNIDDFIKKYSSNVKSLTDNKYLSDISKQRDSIEDIENIVQKNAYVDLIKCLSNPRNIDGLFNWIYIYRKVPFNDTARSLLTREFLKYYNIPTNVDYKIPEFYYDNKLSYNDFKNLSSVKKEAIVNFFGIMLYGKTLPIRNKSKLDDLYSFSSCGIEVSLSSDGKILEDKPIVLENEATLVPEEPAIVEEVDTFVSNDSEHNDDVIVYRPIDENLSNLENINSAVEQSAEIKKVDKLATFTLKNNPEIASDTFHIVVNDTIDVENDKIKSVLFHDDDANIEKKRTDSV